MTRLVTGEMLSGVESLLWHTDGAGGLVADARQIRAVITRPGAGGARYLILRHAAVGTTLIASGCTESVREAMQAVERQVARARVPAPIGSMPREDARLRKWNEWDRRC